MMAFFECFAAAAAVLLCLLLDSGTWNVYNYIRTSNQVFIQFNIITCRHKWVFYKKCICISLFDNIIVSHLMEPHEFRYSWLVIYLDQFVSMVSYMNFSLFVSLCWVVVVAAAVVIDIMKLNLLYVVMKYCYYCFFWIYL